MHINNKFLFFLILSVFSMQDSFCMFSWFTGSNQNATKECSICWDNKEIWTMLQCNHEYCADCVNGWDKKSNTCPECRQIILVDKTYKIAKKIENAGNMTSKDKFDKKLLASETLGAFAIGLIARQLYDSGLLTHKNNNKRTMGYGLLILSLITGNTALSNINPHREFNTYTLAGCWALGLCSGIYCRSLFKKKSNSNQKQQEPVIDKKLY